MIIYFLPTYKMEKVEYKEKNKELQITQRTKKNTKTNNKKNTNTRKRNNNLAKEADKMIVRTKTDWRFIN